MLVTVADPRWFTPTDSFDLEMNEIYLSKMAVDIAYVDLRDSGLADRDPVRYAQEIERQHERRRAIDARRAELEAEWGPIYWGEPFGRPRPLPRPRPRPTAAELDKLAEMDREVHSLRPGNGDPVGSILGWFNGTAQERAERKAALAEFGEAYDRRAAYVKGLERVYGRLDWDALVPRPARR